MQALQKIIIWGNVSLAIAFWADIFIAYIGLNSGLTFFRQFYPGDLENFSGSTIFFIICFHHSIIRKNCCFAVIHLPAAPPELFLHWQLYLMLPSFVFIPPYLWLFFTVTNLWVSDSFRYSVFLENCSWKFPQHFFAIQLVVSCFKKGYRKS